MKPFGFRSSPVYINWLLHCWSDPAFCGRLPCRQGKWGGRVEGRMRSITLMIECDFPLVVISCCPLKSPPFSCHYHVCVHVTKWAIMDEHPSNGLNLKICFKHAVLYSSICWFHAEKYQLGEIIFTLLMITMLPFKWIWTRKFLLSTSHFTAQMVSDTELVEDSLVPPLIVCFSFCPQVLIMKTYSPHQGSTPLKRKELNLSCSMHIIHFVM